jgi:precorrin-3B synthase
MTWEAYRSSLMGNSHYHVPVTANGRPAVDRCPGLLRPYRSEDGLVVRIRIPGGQTDSGILLALSELAETLQLTSRGNIQLRGIAEASLPSMTARIIELGLLPSASHELVRNIVASPLTGITPNRPDLRPLVPELDQAICAEPELVELPGRFLFAIDDGRGDVWPLAFDVGYRALDDQHGVVALGGTSGPSDRKDERVVARTTAAAEMVQVAIDFVRARRGGTSAWRVWEIDEVRPQLSAPSATNAPDDACPRPGVVPGAACIGVPLGFLTAGQAAAVHSVAAGGPVVVTPWRSLIIPGAAPKLDALSVTGLITDPTNPWAMITACVGAPGCAKSLINTRQVAIELAGRPAALVRPVHISGCERRCGAPAGDHEELVGHR